jgi:predicted nucleotidyltransferase
VPLKYDVTPKTGIGKKVQELAESLPYKEWYLPDPYDPSSFIQPIGGMVKAEAQLIKKLPPAFKKNLSKIIRHIKETFPEAEQIDLVGSAARGQMNKKSDIDILTSFPKGTKMLGLWKREMPLEQRWNPWKGGDYIPSTKEYTPLGIGNPWEKVVDFINTIIGEHSGVGQHKARIMENLPTPEIPLWRKK